MNIQRAEMIAKDMMAHHGLSQQGWTFRFNNRKMATGLCNYTRKLIALSKPITLVNSEDLIINTIMHEIAHALVGIGQSHNRIWQLKAIEIGSTPDVCTSESVVRASGNYTMRCVSCGFEETRYKLLSQHKRNGMIHTTCKHKVGGGAVEVFDKNGTKVL